MTDFHDALGRNAAAIRAFDAVPEAALEVDVGKEFFLGRAQARGAEGLPFGVLDGDEARGEARDLGPVGVFVDVVDGPLCCRAGGACLGPDRLDLFQDREPVGRPRLRMMAS